MTFLCYERLTRNLPQSLIDYTKKEIEMPSIPFKIQAVMNGNKFTRHAYNVFVKATASSHTKADQRRIEKWENDVGKYIEGTSVKSMSATNSTQLLYFHFKIISRIFPTKKLLCVMKIKESRECTFCRGETETLTHLFWHCPKVQQFVNELITYMKQK